MLGRLLLGVLAFSSLSLATVATAGASPDGAPTTAPLEAPEAQQLGVPDCTNCVVLVDPCEFRQQCDPLPLGIRPPNLGLHPTVIHANIFNFFPEGPWVCARSRWPGPPMCLTTGVDFASLLPAMAPSMMGPGPGMPMPGPGMMPGMGPGMGPGMAPGMAPGTSPGTGPGTSPGTSPPGGPGTTPGTPAGPNR
jgi:hypothetical protein